MATFKGFIGWDVWLNGVWIDKVWMVPSMKAEEVRTALIEHDGYNPAIDVSES